MDAQAISLYGMNKSIIVDDEEWAEILSEIQKKDAAVRQMMNSFIEVLGVLETEGFTKGVGNRNIAATVAAMKLMQEQLDSLYGGLEKNMNAFISDVNSHDRYVEGSIVPL